MYSIANNSGSYIDTIDEQQYQSEAYCNRTTLDLQLLYLFAL